MQRCTIYIAWVIAQPLGTIRMCGQLSRCMALMTHLGEGTKGCVEVQVKAIMGVGHALKAKGHECIGRYVITGLSTMGRIEIVTGPTLTVTFTLIAVAVSLHPTLRPNVCVAAAGTRRDGE